MKIRMLPCLLLALALYGVIAWQAPHQALVIAYKLTLIALAGVGGYWLDRWAFPYSRPDGFLARPWRERLGFFADAPDNPVAQGCERFYIAAQLRRAAIMAASMLAMGLGL